MEHNKNVKDAKLIFNAGTCRSLLKANCQIIDVKPDRENPDKTVFVFKNDAHFQEQFERINKEIAEAKTKEAHE